MRQQAFRIRRAVLLISLAWAMQCAEVKAASFYGFNSLAGPNSGLQAETKLIDVSADGTVFVGGTDSWDSNYDDDHFEDERAFCWNVTGDVEFLEMLPHGRRPTRAAAISSNGNHIVGQTTIYGGLHATVWHGPQDPCDLHDESFEWDSGAFGVSDDGMTVVGDSSEGYILWRDMAPIPVKDLIADDVAPVVSDLSADGTVLAAYTSHRGGVGPEAFVWSETTGKTTFGFDAINEAWSEANAISRNGEFVVGTATRATTHEVFRWSQSAGITYLGNLLSTMGPFQPYDVSDDGAIVVGACGAYPRPPSLLENRVAFIWNEANGMRPLRDVLIGNYGINLDGWKLHVATACSADGTVIAGFGTNPQGYYEGFVVTIPELRQTCNDRPEGDVTGDCAADAVDLAVLSMNWLTCNRQTRPRFYVLEELIAPLGPPSDLQDISADGQTVLADGYGMDCIWRTDGTWSTQGGKALSADGNTIVDFGWNYAAQEAQAMKYGLTDPGKWLGRVPCTNKYGWMKATAVSADGSVVAGVGETDLGMVLWRWTAETGLLAIDEDPVNRSTGFEARDICDDGTIIVGYKGARAFFWTASTGIAGLIKAEDAYPQTHAEAISGDGSIIVGCITDALGAVACHWTDPCTVVALGRLTDDTNSCAFASTYDGTTIVGMSGDDAAIWDEANGMRHLASVLATEHGIDLQGAHLGCAKDISADGRVIAGSLDGRYGPIWMAFLDGGPAYCTGVVAGDANGDCGVDLGDLGLLAQGWMSGE